MPIPSAPSTRASKTLYFSVGSALFLLLALAFQWNLVDVLTPFLILPLLGLAWLLVLIAVVLATAHGYRHRTQGARALGPLLVAFSALVLALFVPFTQLWLHANFSWNQAEREQIVDQIKAGALVPNVAHNPNLIALPKGSGLSMGGDEILVEAPLSDPYVFFFTFRGILDNYSGFLWVPDGGKPEEFYDARQPGTQIEPLGGQWYFIGHR